MIFLIIDYIYYILIFLRNRLYILYIFKFINVIYIGDNINVDVNFFVIFYLVQVVIVVMGVLEVINLFIIIYILLVDMFVLC